MKFLAVTAGIFFLAAPLALAQTSTWKSDPAHSEVTFTIRHLSISNVTGRFEDVNATIHYDPNDVTRSKVVATVGVSSVDTGDSGRDDELKSDDFFNVSHFPTATFVSTSFSKNGDGLWIRGNLTLHGVTKPIVLNVKGPTPPVRGSDGKTHSSFTATTTINRINFGIGSDFPDAVVGDSVKLQIDLKIVKQQ